MGDAAVAPRIATGVGIGLSSCVVPVYISEVAPVAIRGALGSYNQLAICVGILGALIAGLPLAASNPGWWRTMFAMAAVPALALLFGAMAIPESPRWLAKTV
jgi:MFS family permease